MMSVGLAGLVLLLGLGGMSILIAFALIGWLRSGTSKGDQARRDEEAQTYQEMYRGFQRMEERIEALETILMDKGGRSSRDVRSGSDSID